jgi:hypothetical protein
MKDWKMYSEVKNACILVMVVSIGVLIGINLPDNKPTKHYPIEVLTHWETSQSGAYPTMKADSVKGDTIWKDGSKIVNKNIINVEFK